MYLRTTCFYRFRFLLIIFLSPKERLVRANDRAEEEFFSGVKLAAHCRHLFQEEEQRKRGVEAIRKLSNIICPVSPNHTLDTLEGEPEIKTSKTAPNILTYTCRLTEDKTTEKTFKLLCKFEDIRQDSIVTSLIRLSKRILDEATKKEHCLVTYNVLPTSTKTGFIECVQGARDLRQIEQEHASLGNYLTNVNPDLYRPGKPHRTVDLRM